MLKLKQPIVDGLLQNREMLCEMNFNKQVENTYQTSNHMYLKYDIFIKILLNSILKTIENLN